MDNFAFSYPRYLAAKETVDERALNERVLRCFLDQLTERTGATLRILEIGGGTGAMLRRLIPLLERDSNQSMEYTLIDQRAENVEEGERALRFWAHSTEYDITKTGKREYHLNDGGFDHVRVQFIAGDFFEYAGEGTEGVDAIVAQAVLDLVDLDRTFRHLRSRLRHHGLWYLPTHFDGTTTFEPIVDPDLDRNIEQAYHRSMLDPHTGRHMLTALRTASASLLEVGSSDWIVFGSNGAYPKDEQYFLHSILHFIKNEVSTSDRVDTDDLEKWIRRRTQQVEAGDLIYLAHQLDVCAEHIH